MCCVVDLYCKTVCSHFNGASIYSVTNSYCAMRKDAVRASGGANALRKVLLIPIDKFVCVMQVKMKCPLFRYNCLICCSIQRTRSKELLEHVVVSIYDLGKMKSRGKRQFIV